MSDDTVWWAKDWRCPECGALVPIEPGQDTRPVEAEHVCNELDLQRAAHAEFDFALDLTDYAECTCGHYYTDHDSDGCFTECGCGHSGPGDAESGHECVFVEEREPSGRLILPPCIVCGLTAMDALEQLRGER